MDIRTKPTPEAAFPGGRRLGIALFLSLVLALVGGVGFVGLLRLSVFRVSKAVALYADPNPWPGSPHPAALAVRFLDSGRLTSPAPASKLEVEGALVPVVARSQQNLLFELPPLHQGSRVNGKATAVSEGLESPPLRFGRTAASDAPKSREFNLEGLGSTVRAFDLKDDNVLTPTVAALPAGCSDRVSVIPAGGVAQRFLESVLLVRVTDLDGQPRRQVEIEIHASRLGTSAGRVAAGHTDGFGIAEVALTLDAEAYYQLQWSCSGKSVSVALSIPLQADGMTTDWLPETVGTSRPIVIRAVELRSRALWQADLFCGGRWTQSQVLEMRSGTSLFTLGLVPESSSTLPCLLQASTQPYLPHPLHTSLWILPSGGLNDLRSKSIELLDRMRPRAAGTLADQLGTPTRVMLATAEEPELRRAVRWLLSWLPRNFVQRPLLADSGDRDLRAMQAFKAMWRGRFRAMLGVGVLGLLLLWLPRSVSGLLEDRRRLAAVFADGGEGEREGLMVSRAWLSAAGLILAALAAIAAIAALVWVVS